LLVALGGVVVHQASALPTGAGHGEPIADTGHGERGGSAHLDSLVLRPGHECLACWLGNLGVAAPLGATAADAPVALAPVALVAAHPSAPPTGARLGRGPPLAG
jgi:hypothetical protein